MSGALHGVRVVEFGHYVSAPLVGVLLADQGADVIRIDPPWVAEIEGETEAFLHRGKRRLTLDLKQAEDAAVARRLVDRADVVVENFRPGVLTRLGLDHDTTAATNPRLIYCSIPGFAADDPRAARPAWEGTVAAAAANTGLRFPPEGWDTSRPTYTALPLASNFAAFLASYAIVTALTDRLRTGRGEQITVPLFNAMFELIGGAGVYLAAHGLRTKPRLIANGSGTYRCADGRWVQFDPIGASTRFIGWFLDAVDRPELADRARQHPDDADVQAELRTTLTDLFTERPAAEWDALAARTGVPLSMIRTSAEWADTEHARSSEAVVRLDDPVLGATWMAGRTIHLSTPHRELDARHRPDADRSDILAELDEATPPTAAPSAPAPSAANDELPYAGLRVVDLCQVLAGPSGARLLVEFGADVVKVNAPHRKVDAHGYVNRGKRTILIDIQSAAGQEVLGRIIENADVLTINFPDGTPERYGLGYEQVRARNPRIVYLHVTCFGHPGPWASRRGYETQGQATTGMMERHGRDGQPGVHGPYNVLDYGTGMVTGLAAALGIYHRTSIGEGVRVTTSLAQVGTLHQATLTVRSAAAQRQEPAGRWALGATSLQRYYEASDAWFFLGARPTDLPLLAEVDGLADAAGATGIDDDERISRLEVAFKQRRAADWVSDLQARDIGASGIETLADLLVDPVIRARGLTVEQLSPEAGEVIMPGTAIRLRSRTIRPGAPSRQPGSDARSVLADVGLEGRLDELADAGAVQVSGLPGGWIGY